MDRDGFCAHLDRLGIPHRQSLGELVSSYGVRTCPYYDWNVVAISDAQPLVPGQVQPPDFEPRYQPDLLPPPAFSVLVSAHPDARKNHAKTRAYLESIFGVPAETSASNTLGNTWTFDTAFVSLTTWPPERQRFVGDNPAHERHPEMKAFCHLTFGAGHVVPLSAQERQWLANATSLPPGGVGEFESGPNIWGYCSSMRGCLRRLPRELAGCERFVGISGDLAALVGMNGQDGFVLPKESVVGVDLQHLAPAKGPGRSRLELRYLDPFTSKENERSKGILLGSSPSSLDQTARFVADWAAKELRHFESIDD